MTSRWNEAYYGKEGKVVRATSGYTWLWVMLFGPFFFMWHGLHSEAIFHSVLLVFSLGLSTFIVPFFVYSMVELGYELKGWTRLSEYEVGKLVK